MPFRQSPLAETLELIIQGNAGGRLVAGRLRTLRQRTRPVVYGRADSGRVDTPVPTGQQLEELADLLALARDRFTEAISSLRRAQAKASAGVDVRDVPR